MAQRKNLTTFESLIDLARLLRNPGGCPWDQSQTLQSLFACLQDETQELGAAIEADDADNMEEEIGDTLFNLAALIVLAEERQLTSFAAIANRIKDKIISRHTWVFGNDKAATAEEAMAIWKKNKEKNNHKSNKSLKHENNKTNKQRSPKGEP
jgi:uncharacterized protein YabN with tetrapyrrole methylase and pyrophosphatase domain